MTHSSPARAIAILSLLASSAGSWAHDGLSHDADTDSAAPTQQLTLDLDLRQGRGSHSAPAALVQIDHPAAANLRELNADRSTLAWQANWLPGLQTQWAVSYDREREQLTNDQAWLRWAAIPGSLALQAGRFSPAQALATDAWGRSSLRDTLLTGGHDHWHDSGLALQLQQPGRRLTLSALRGESNPGTRRDGTQAGLWLLALEQDLGPLQLGLTAADTPRVSRQNALAGDGHSHSHGGASGCQRTLACLSGEGQWLELAARGQLYGVTLRGALGSRQEQGTLGSATGQVDYDGRTDWLAVEATTAALLLAGVDASVRYERLRLQHTLTGTNAAMLAKEAGIASSQHKPEVLGVRLRWQPAKHQQVSLEWQEDQTDAHSRQRWLLRWQHQFRLLP
jgi:uncharacterized membrane protein